MQGTEVLEAFDGKGVGMPGSGLYSCLCRLRHIQSAPGIGTCAMKQRHPLTCPGCLPLHYGRQSESPRQGSPSSALQPRCSTVPTKLSMLSLLHRTINVHAVLPNCHSTVTSPQLILQGWALLGEGARVSSNLDNAV